MAKSKSTQANTAAKLSKNETPKAKSKEVAKQAVKAQEASKKSKKAKEPTPEVDSDDSEEDDDSEDSVSSISSDDDSEEESSKINGAKTNGVKTNGTVKAAPKGEAETSDSSESSSDDDEDDSEDDSEDDESAAPVHVATAKANKAADDDSEDDSEDDSDVDSEDDNEKPTGGVSSKAMNGKLSKVAPKDDDSEEDSDDSENSEEDSDDSDDSDESEEEKPAPKNNKRKAETEAAPAAKKSKNAETDELDDASKKNLFVGHLSYNVDEDWMSREFEVYGELTRVVHMMDRETGRPRGFGYVEFANPEDGVKAQEAMNGKEIDGRAINVDFSRPKTEQQPRQDRAKQYGDKPLSPPSSTIFVANLAFSATSDAVGEAFGEHGEVVGVRLPTDRETGEPKGFGYVELSSVEEAQKVFAAMEGQAILGRVPRLDYSTPRPERTGDSPGGRGGFSRGGGRGGFDRGGRGGGRGRGGFDRGGRGGGRGGRGGSTNRGGFGDFQGKKMSFN